MTDDGATMMDGSAGSSIHIIIPVRNMAVLLEGCLGSLVPQLRPGDAITVVDDCSTDATGDVARAAGVDVLRTERQSGPYIARHLAAAASTARNLLFVDGRCLARPGLVETHRRLLAVEGTVLSCTNIEICPGPSLAERIAMEHDYFNLEGKIGGENRPDFFPTVNLGVVRAAYDAVGGFRPLRSGSDADLCWRIQFAGLGRMGFERASLMTWRPRTELIDLVEQNYRYGMGTAFLDWLHSGEMSRYRSARSPEARSVPAGDRTPPPKSLGIKIAALTLHIAFRVGLARGHRRYRAVPDPATFRPLGQLREPISGRADVSSDH